MVLGYSPPGPYHNSTHGIGLMWPVPLPNRYVEKKGLVTCPYRTCSVGMLHSKSDYVKMTHFVKMTIFSR